MEAEVEQLTRSFHALPPLALAEETLRAHSSSYWLMRHMGSMWTRPR